MPGRALVSRYTWMSGYCGEKVLGGDKQPKGLPPQKSLYVEWGRGKEAAPDRLPLGSSSRGTEVRETTRGGEDHWEGSLLFISSVIPSLMPESFVRGIPAHRSSLGSNT